MDAADRFFAELRKHPMLPPQKTIASFRQLEALRRRRRRAMLATPGFADVLRRWTGAAADDILAALDQPADRRARSAALGRAASLFAGLELSVAEEDVLAEELASRNGYASAVQVACLGARMRRIRERIVTGNMRLVVRTAGRFRGHSMELIDLFQEGIIGLMTAVDRFQVQRGWAFSTYAVWWLRQTMNRAFDIQDRVVRQPIHQIQMARRAMAEGLELDRATRDDRLEVAARMQVRPGSLDIALRWLERPASLDAPVLGGDLPLGSAIADSSQDPDRKVQQLHVQDLLVRLPVRDAWVLRQRFGIETDEKTLEEVGLELGVTRERARQLEAAALRKLRLVSAGTRLRASEPAKKKPAGATITLEEGLGRLNGLARLAHARRRKGDPRIRDLAIELMKRGALPSKVQHIVRASDGVMMRWCQAAGCPASSRPESVKLRRLAMMARRARRRHDAREELYAYAVELLAAGVPIEGIARAARVRPAAIREWSGCGSFFPEHCSSVTTQRRSQGLQARRDVSIAVAGDTP